MADQIKTVEVHNVWAIHGLNPDGTEAEQKLAMHDRPQDWGHPRWAYFRFRFEWTLRETHYINHAHCWTDLTLEEWRYPVLFSSLIVQILQPGEYEQFCDRSHLKEDDFWSEDWGPRPPFFDPPEEEDEW